MSEDSFLSRPERQWRAAVCLGWPLAMGAVPVLMSLGDLPLCAFRRLTGHPCPLCGGTHACAALLQGDIIAAWQANPGMLILMAIAAVNTAILAREALSGRRLGTQRPYSWVWAGGGAFLLLAWGRHLLAYI